MNKFGLIGHPLTHSCSSIIHEELFNLNKIQATYEHLDIEEREIESVLKQLRSGYYQGLNVTIPYKEKVLPHLDILTPAVEAIGACNTIYYHEGKLIGDNTDYYGFIKQLEYQSIDVKNKNVYILGNGGAAKALSYALNILGANVTVVSRRGGFSYQELEELAHIDVLINTTPLGMYPNLEASPVNEDVVKRTDVCIDIIYNPRQTLFLKMANQKNEGLPMLIFQAVKAEEIWQKKPIEVDYEKIKSACERKLI